MGKHTAKSASAKMDKYLSSSQPPPESISERERAASPTPPTAEQAPTSHAEPTNRDILQAITDSHTSMTSQLDTIKIDISHLRQDLQNLRERTSEVELRVSSLEDATRPMPEELSRLNKQVADAMLKADDLENRLRRNNLRLVGLPENSEGNKPERFAEDWLRQTLGADQFSPFLVIERAHRVPTRPLPPGANPRPLIMRFLNYRDRDAALSAARAKGQLTYNGAPISLFPDYSISVQKQRASFIGVKRRLRSEGLIYSVLFPAKLRIIDGPNTHFFLSSAEADRWLDSRGAYGNQRAGSPRQ